MIEGRTEEKLFRQMITCSVCGRENDELRTLCLSCKSFIQGRVDALNLFETIWGIIESPGITFRRIVLAKHKNYTIFLSSIAGVTLVFYVAWYKHVADRLQSLLPIVGTALIVGPLAGISFVLALAYIIRFVSKKLGGDPGLKNLFAALAYGTVPLCFSLVFLIPVEIAVFGSDFFGTNPPPMTIRPVEYSVLLALKSVSALWMLFLLVHGTMAANAFPKKKIFSVSLILVALFVGVVTALNFVKI